MKKFILLILSISSLIFYSCTGLHQIKGKERELVINSLENEVGINPSEIHIVADAKYGYSDYKEVKTQKVAVPNRDMTSVTFKTVQLTTPCLKLSPTYSTIMGLIVLSNNDLFFVEIYENGSIGILDSLKFDNINSIAIPYEDTYKRYQIQMILDEKKAIVLNSKSSYMENKIYSFIKKQDVKYFNSCGVNYDVPVLQVLTQGILEVMIGYGLPILIH